MKTFITAFVLSATAAIAPAMAAGFDFNPLTRTLTFPEPVTQPVTKDTTIRGN
nr:hypothetical protein [uncultured Ruegeria sp.]